MKRQSVAPRPRLGGVLDGLGVFGCGELEDAILAGLALGEPILLIGGPGCAKTRLAERLAAGLRMRFWAYDACKALFEDVVGFPDPSSLADGEVRYVPTRLSLWGKEFILVDEISRANPSMQNKWLEVVRSRRLMGMELADLKEVVAAMNPAGLPGTVALDEALAGRFTFHLEVPEAHRMAAADRRRVIEAPDLGPADSELPDLRPMLASIREALPVVESRDGAVTTGYVEHLADYFAGRECPLDGRRLGMIRRALLSMVAAHEAAGTPTGGLDALLALFHHGLDCALPFAATGRPIGRLVIDGAHEFASASARGQTRLLPPADVLATTRRLLATGDAPDDPDRVSLLVTRIFQDLDHPRSADVGIRSGAALLTLATSRTALRRLRTDTRFRVLSGYRDLLDLAEGSIGPFLAQAERIAPPPGMDPALRDAALRIAFVLSDRLERLPQGGADFDEVARRLMEEYRMKEAA